MLIPHKRHDADMAEITEEEIREALHRLDEVEKRWPHGWWIWIGALVAVPIWAWAMVSVLEYFFGRI